MKLTAFSSSSSWPRNVAADEFLDEAALLSTTVSVELELELPSSVVVTEVDCS